MSNEKNTLGVIQNALKVEKTRNNIICLAK